jgi:DHA1 family tetracycline resistance protein-like MFS transporter
VLYTTYRFEWGPRENGWSLFAMGLASLVVQGFLLAPLLRRFSARHLAVAGLLSSGVGYVCWGLATADWVMYAVIAGNLLGWTITASIQSIVSNAADAHTQGETMGAVSSLASLMAVLAPLLGTTLMAAVSTLARDDWRVGAPMYFCALLQFAAMMVAVRHSRRGHGPGPARTERPGPA